MPRKLTAKEARRIVAQRKTKRGGRPLKPTLCPRCQTLCAGYTLARVHCSAKAAEQFDAQIARGETRPLS